MATPSTFPNPAREAQDLNEKESEAYQQGQDADTFTTDVEKGAQSQAISTHTDERTLSGSVAPQEEASDPDIVDWDGPDDPANPLNWPMKKKWSIIAALGAVTFITPLASSFFAPGVPQVMLAFEEQSNLMATFVVSVYLLGFAIGMLLLATSCSQANFLARPSCHRTHVRNVRTNAHLQHLQCSLRHLQHRLRSINLHGYAHRLPATCWLRWCLAFDPWRWHNCRHVPS